MYTLLRKEYNSLQKQLPEWAELEEEGGYCEDDLDFRLELIPPARLKSIILNSEKLGPSNKRSATVGDIVAYRDHGSQIKYVMIGGYVVDQSNYDVRVVSYASKLGKLLLYTTPGCHSQIDLPNGGAMNAWVLDVYKST
jgi:hypothetical protein